MRLLSRFSIKGRAFAFGRGAARAMLFSATAVIEKAGGVNQISPGDICIQVLKLRPHWNVRDDGIVEFRGQPVSDWLGGATSEVVAKIEADTTVGNLTPTVIVTEYTRLFTVAQGRRSLIQSALDGCSEYFQKKGLYVYDTQN